MAITDLNFLNVILKKHHFMLYISLVMAANLITRCSAQRIGIIGGGIGGTSCAYFLRDLLPQAEIDIVEKGDVGGRLAVVTIGDRQYEAGGAIIHPKNRYMQQLVKQLGLRHRRDQKSGLMGLYDGKEFVFKESSSEMLSTLKLMWRYGLSLYNMGSSTKAKLRQFDRIYKLQENGTFYLKVVELVEALSPDLLQAIYTPARTGFLNSGMSEQLINELVTAVLRVNYGQTVDTVHEFVGFVSLAGAEHGLWSVEGGNYQVPKKLLQASGANLIKGTVHEVRQHPEKTGYDLIWLDERKEEKKSSYDIVILASPHTLDFIPMIDLPKKSTPIPNRRMHKLYVTFVQGTLNYAHFGLTADDGIEDIISLWEDPFFNSVSIVKPVDGTDPDLPDMTNVYKVFSSKPLNIEELDTLFSRRDVVVARNWFAYPRYDPANTDFRGTFVLNNGLFYLNAIEWAASAMEMSCIGAKNIANLCKQYLYPQYLQQKVTESNVETATSAAKKVEL